MGGFRAETIAENGLVAIVRLDDLSAAIPLTEALLRGGVRSVEFTFTNPLAGRVIEQVRGALTGQVAVGAGSVLDPERPASPSSPVLSSSSHQRSTSPPSSFAAATGCRPSLAR